MSESGSGQVYWSHLYLVECPWRLGMYWYIDGLSSMGISKLLSLDFLLLGEIPRIRLYVLF